MEEQAAQPQVVHFELTAYEFAQLMSLIEFNFSFINEDHTSAKRLWNRLMSQAEGKPMEVILSDDPRHADYREPAPAKETEPVKRPWWQIFRV